jgi:hypothetical protein
MTHLDTLQRRQDERIQHLQALQALIDQKQREIDNLRANQRIGQTAHRFALLHGYA